MATYHSPTCNNRAEHESPGSMSIQSHDKALTLPTTDQRQITMSANGAATMAFPASIDSTSTITAPSFQQLLNDLPTELYLSIKDLVFTAGPKLEAKVDQTYTQPSNLQVSRQTRADAAKSYYNNTTFITASSICTNWIPSMPDEHVTQIRNIHLDGPPITKPATGTAKEVEKVEEEHHVRFRQRAYLMHYLSLQNIRLDPSAAKMWVCLRATGPTERVTWAADFKAFRAATTAEMKRAAFLLQCSQALARQGAEERSARKRGGRSHG